MNDPSQMMSRGFPIWPPAPAEDSMPPFQIPRPMFAPQAGPFSGIPSRVHWKTKRSAGGKRKKLAARSPSSAGYKPPALKDLQMQNRAKARRFYPKKKHARFAPFAPRNTTSFLIRAKRSGGIASLVSPCPVTPAILPTPRFSPSSEVLGDMAKEEWGVDGYGSMKGLIRLRRGGGDDAEEDGDENGSSESDLEEHLEMEKRMDHDLSRFEMLYPGSHGGHNTSATAYLLENRANDHDALIEQLEEENLTMKEKMFLIEQEVGDLRRRLQLLETDWQGVRENGQEANIIDAHNDRETVEDGSEHNCGGDLCSDKSLDNEGGDDDDDDEEEEEEEEEGEEEEEDNATTSFSPAAASTGINY